MKIGFFTRCLCDGGTELVAAKLSILWSDLGHNVVFLTHFPVSANDFAHVCSRRIVAKSGMWTKDVLFGIVSSERFDVAVINGGWNSLDFRFIVQVCRHLHINIVTIIHHSFNNWALAKCNEGDFDKDDVLPLINALVCVDRIQAFWWSRRHSSVVWIENPVSVASGQSLIVGYEAVNGCIDRSEKEIVWIGRPRDGGKRIELAIDVFKIISKKDVTARLTIIGDIDDVQKKALLGRLDDEVQKRVTFTGFVMDTRPYLIKATVNLVTTLWEVTVPQVILEAQAVGVPTVAFDLPVLRGGRGIKSVGSVEEMAAVVLDLKVTGVRGERTPFIDVAERNANVKERWKTLFAALRDGRIAKFAERNAVEWRTLKNAELLIDEIQRGERIYVCRDYPRLKHLDLFRMKANRILRFLGIRI